MKLNGRRVATGIAAAGIAAGVLAGGGVALAATNTTPAHADSTSADPPCGMRAGYGFGQSGRVQAQAGQQTMLAAAARYLGMTQTELRTQLQDGKSFADVAQAQSKSVPGLKDAILAAVTNRMNANTRLTAEQKETILAQVKSNLDTIVHATHPAGTGFGPMWARR